VLLIESLTAYLRDGYLYDFQASFMRESPLVNLQLAYIPQILQLLISVVHPSANMHAEKSFLDPNEIQSTPLLALYAWTESVYPAEAVQIFSMILPAPNPPSPSPS
jgi:hypothetical protein